MEDKETPRKRPMKEYNSAGGGGRGRGDGDGTAAPRPENPSSPPRSPSPPEPFTYNFGDGSGAGGGGGHGAAATPTAPQQKPPSSLPRSPSPPEPFTYNFGRGSGPGGRGGGAAAATPTALRPGPSSSAPRSPSLPKPFTYNFGVGGRAGGGGGKGAAPQPPAPQREPSSPPVSSSSSESDDDGEVEDPDSEYEELCELEHERRNGSGSLFMSDPRTLTMYSSDPQNPPHYIGRQGCEPLSTLEFFSLRHNWQQLLDGKNTYLRPPNDQSNYVDSVFKKPKPLGNAVGCQDPVSILVRAGAGKRVLQQKFKILSEHYVYFRHIRRDGSQFYRAFLFSYLENLGKMQGSKAEVTRLMECLARCRENFCRLQWNNAYFSNPKAFFSSVVSEFEHLVNSVANGLNGEELYKRSLQETTTSRILSLLRLLTEAHIRTHEVDYNRMLGQETNVFSFCINYVRPFGAEAGGVQMSALSVALGIPLHLAYVDKSENNRTVQVKCVDFLPEPESGVSRRLRPLSAITTYYLSSATDKHPGQGRDYSNLKMPAGNLFSSDRKPLVTLMSGNGNDSIAVLYRK